MTNILLPPTQAAKPPATVRSAVLPPLRPAHTSHRPDEKADLPCPHRGGLLGQLDCACGGKPAVLVCAIYGRCVRHAPGKPPPYKFVPLKGTSEMLSRDDAPANCALCLDGPNGARLVEMRATAGLRWPTPERWDPARLRFVRCADLAEHTLRLVPQLPPDAAGIVGVPRSGMLPAGILATATQLPLYYLDRKAGPVPMPGGGRETMLRRNTGPLVVVDDTTWMGQSMRRARKLMGRIPAIYAAVYPRDPRDVDVYAVHHPGSHILEWNIFNNGPLAGSPSFPEFAGGAACDFDGVLCEEPIVSDHQDLPAFLRWLSAARPLYLPRQVPVPLVISFRLEAWRDATQAWLDRWGVRVREMVLHPAASVQDRDRLYDVARHKGQTFARSRCSVMFESDPKQCQIIHATSGKHVICPRTGQVWQGGQTAAVAQSARNVGAAGGPTPHNSVSLSRLAVVTCLFARTPSRNRAANFRDFSGAMHRAGVELWGIEGLFPGQTPLSAAGNHWRHVKLDHTLWHKERMLNLLVEILPIDFDAVAWADADLLFDDPAGLSARVLAGLRKTPVAQIWDVAEQLGPDDRPAVWWNGQQTIQSMAAANIGRPLPDTHAGRSHAGFAWAMRRDTWRACGGLYEREVNGGADATMTAAFWGDQPNGRTDQINIHMQKAVAAWSERAYAAIRGQVGCVPGTIRHLYHGTIPNRRYWERLITVSRLGYDPQNHLLIEPGKPLRWSAAAPQELRDYLGHYLTTVRGEDDHLRAGA